MSEEADSDSDYNTPQQKRRRVGAGPESMDMDDDDTWTLESQVDNDEDHHMVALASVVLPNTNLPCAASNHSACVARRKGVSSLLTVRETRISRLDFEANAGVRFTVAHVAQSDPWESFFSKLLFFFLLRRLPFLPWTRFVGFYRFLFPFFPLCGTATLAPATLALEVTATLITHYFVPTR